MDPAELVDDWPAERVAVIATDRVTGAVTEVGDTSEVFRLASITKVITALAVMVAVEEGTVD
ncbi:MAG: serine hydrolase, partial [Ilumatobacter sp.]